jgi:hypothetical protein
VWEIVVEARRTSDAVAAPYTLTVSALGASVAPNPDTIASAKLNTPLNRQYTLTNEFVEFTGRATGTNLGSAKMDRPTISQGQTKVFTLAVTPGATQLRAKIGNPADLAADLDLYVDNCTSGTCVPAGNNADGDSEEQVTISNPAPGEWRVRVVGYGVPSADMAYDYLDVFSGAAFGTIAVTDANAVRPAGASWTVTGVVTPMVTPAAGRVLFGTVEIRTDQNALVGSGNVIVQAVTP